VSEANETRHGLYRLTESHAFAQADTNKYAQEKKMCFYTDCEWYASISEESTTTATKEKVCNECYRKIKVGQPIYTLHQQEHELCQACEMGECECPENEELHDCQCDRPAFGETFDYLRCWDCHLFLECVEKAELAAGCPIDTARPSLCGMTEDIGRANGDMDDAKRYFKVAAKTYPELVKSGYLGWLWRKLF
jgi:hypothetical protein